MKTNSKDWSYEKAGFKGCKCKLALIATSTKKPMPKRPYKVVIKNTHTQKDIATYYLSEKPSKREARDFIDRVKISD
jgi:hypothetical protein